MKNKLSLQEEIYTEEVRTENNMTIGIFVTILAILGISIIMLSIQYSTNNQAQLINLNEMNQ